MNDIHCKTLKAKSTHKEDLRIVLHDMRTNINSELGFSIKSQLGASSTLLNASGATNFDFRVEGTPFSDEEMAVVNALNNKKTKVLDRIAAIRDKGGHLVFDGMDKTAFRNNLVMLDSYMPEIVAHLLLLQLDSPSPMLKELTEELTRRNPLNYDLTAGAPIYEFKVKQLLTAVALGMMPAKVWSGRFSANGGYLVVKKDGDILCYHIYDRNLFEDYLYANTYLERASTKKFAYARLYRAADNSCHIKLNLQIRFK